MKVTDKCNSHNLINLNYAIKKAKIAFTFFVVALTPAGVAVGLGFKGCFFKKSDTCTFPLSRSDVARVKWPWECAVLQSNSLAGVRMFFLILSRCGGLSARIWGGRNKNIYVFMWYVFRFYTHILYALCQESYCIFELSIISSETAINVQKCTSEIFRWAINAQLILFECVDINIGGNSQIIYRDLSCKSHDA